MALFATVGVLVTSATATIYGQAIWDPVQLASRMGSAGVIFALIALLVATLTTNLAANVVAPAYGFSNLAPRRISFVVGGYITAGLGVAMFPWKLMESAGSYLFVWLVGYSALLGPIAGILIADYFLIRKTQFRVEDFFRKDGAFGRNGGWNIAGLAALAIGVLPNLPIPARGRNREKRSADLRHALCLRLVRRLRCRRRRVSVAGRPAASSARNALIRSSRRKPGPRRSQQNQQVTFSPE